MSNPVREVQITLRLDPRQASDRLALAMLQRGYQRGSQLNSDNDAFDFFALRLHKDIYLSGVFLSLLDPELVKCLSRNLQLNCLTPAYLYHALEEHGLTPAAESSPCATLDPAASDALVARIADRLSPLLGAQDGASGPNEHSGQLQAQVERLQQQLQEQSELLQQQARLLDILAAAGGAAPPAPTREHTPVAKRDSDVQLHDLSVTAAKVRKVREKGIF